LEVTLLQPQYKSKQEAEFDNENK